MEGNGYFMPLRNAKRYTPYEFDKMMSHNENRMNTLGKIIDQDIYNCMMADRKTPLVLTPKLILDNSNGINSLGPRMNSNNFNSQSQRIIKNPLQQMSNDSFRLPQSPGRMNSFQRQKLLNEENNIINNNKELQHNLNDEFTKFDPEEEINSHHWKYDGPTGYNMERKHYPRMLNNESYFRNRNDEPVKLNHTDLNNNDIYNRNNDLPENYKNRNNNINNFRSQEISRSRSNNYMKRPIPYKDVYNDRYNNERFNNENYEETNNNDFRNNNIRAFSPDRNNYNKINDNYNENSKEKSDYVRRGYYNSQLNFPNDRYQN